MDIAPTPARPERVPHERVIESGSHIYAEAYPFVGGINDLRWKWACLDERFGMNLATPDDCLEDHRLKCGGGKVSW